MKATTSLIKKIIEQKNRGNRRFSLRTLAKKMQIPSGRLSDIFSGKRRLTDYYLEKIFAALKLNDAEIAQIRQVFHKESYATEGDPTAEPFLLTDGLIKQLVHWKIYGLMSFLETTLYTKIQETSVSPSGQAKDIGKCLNLPEQEVTDLLKLMESAHFVRWDEQQKKWMANLTNTTTGYDIPSPTIMAYHQQVLDLAKQKLAEVPMIKRDFSTMTFTIASSDIPRAKKILRDFRQKFVKRVESGKKQNVYQLAMQFYPLSESGE